MSAHTPHNAAGISIIVPAYNEEGAVAAVVAELVDQFGVGRLSAEYEILVIDDASSDFTGERAAAAGATVIRHHKNRGYGASIKTGLKNCRYETVVITDADSTYPARYIPELIELLEQQSLLALDRFVALVPQLKRRLGSTTYQQVPEDVDNLHFREAAAVG